MAAGYFRSGRDQLQAELARLRLIVARRIAWDRRAGRLPLSVDPLERGFIAPDQVDAWLARHDRDAEAIRDTEVVELLERCHALEGESYERAQRAAEVGVRLPLVALAEGLGLSEFARDVLLLAVGAELDGGLRKALGFLANDITRQHLDLELAMDLLCQAEYERDAARDELAPTAALFGHRLLVPPGHHTDDDLSLLRMPLRPSRRVVDYLRDVDEPDVALLGAARIDRAAAGAAAPLLRPDQVEVLDREEQRFTAAAANARDAGQGWPVLLLTGPEGGGKSSVARRLAGRLGRASLLRVDLDTLDRRARDVFPRIWREAVLQDALVSLERVETLDPAGLHQLARDLAFARAPVVLESRAQVEVHAPGPLFRVELGTPGHAERTELWRRHLPGLPASISSHLGLKHRVTGGSIERAAAAVSSLGARAAAAAVVTTVERALADRRVHELGTLARRVTTLASWEDLILPAETVDELRSLAEHFRHRSKVMLDWGLERVLGTGQGLAALFEGPPGTGKTLAAGVLAREFDMELFQVDVSRIVSKWMGETEKNLARIFDEADRANAILLFDEADSLFSKRTEVKSSNDRHANLEVNFLLQKMDEYKGITVLTSNFGSSIDQAFARRLTARVHFGAPDQAERERLWAALIPPEMELQGEVDYAHLAERFDFSGGHIRNCVLRAAVYAARLGGGVSEEHFIRAGNAEYKALGRVVREDEE